MGSGFLARRSVQAADEARSLYSLAFSVVAASVEEEQPASATPTATARSAVQRERFMAGPIHRRGRGAGGHGRMVRPTGIEVRWPPTEQHAGNASRNTGNKSYPDGNGQRRFLDCLARPSDLCWDLNREAGTELNAPAGGAIPAVDPAAAKCIGRAGSTISSVSSRRARSRSERDSRRNVSSRRRCRYRGPRFAEAMHELESKRLVSRASGAAEPSCWRRRRASTSYRR